MSINTKFVYVQLMGSFSPYKFSKAVISLVIINKNVYKLQSFHRHKAPSPIPAHHLPPLSNSMN
jgi:hypothetical protein